MRNDRTLCFMRVALLLILLLTLGCINADQQNEGELRANVVRFEAPSIVGVSINLYCDAGRNMLGSEWSDRLWFIVRICDLNARATRYDDLYVSCTEDVRNSRLYMRGLSGNPMKIEPRSRVAHQLAIYLKRINEPSMYSEVKDALCEWLVNGPSEKVWKTLGDASERYESEKINRSVFVKDQVLHDWAQKVKLREYRMKEERLSKAIEILNKMVEDERGCSNIILYHPDDKDPRITMSLRSTDLATILKLIVISPAVCRSRVRVIYENGSIVIDHNGDSGECPDLL